MLTDSIYKNSGNSANGRKQRLLGLSKNAIQIIAECKPDQLVKIYERYSIRSLKSEILAWEKLAHGNVAEILENIIEERKGMSRRKK